ncbi:MAG TPA: MFS transporter, partial [Streptosporangiaceae bacterium]|nr:MFS transporter [Streptosporangiaceae bacterium]
RLRRGRGHDPVTAAGGRVVTAVLRLPVRAFRRGGAAARGQLTTAVGGPARVRAVVLLACVLALASADTATVGAAAAPLRRALGISNTDIGLLVTVTALVGAAFSLPFGVLADRARRTWILGFTLLTWGAAMLWGATSSSFGQLLLTRACLGAVTAAAGPVVASLVGDWFPGAERGRIYGFILTGELVGAGVGFAVTGDIAALSWRAAFVILALPAFVLAWLIFKVPEPARGGSGALQPEPPASPARASPAPVGPTPAGQPEAGPADEPGTAGPERAAAAHPAAAPPPDPASLARSKGIQPDPRLIGLAHPGMRFIASVRYVLAVRTNVVLIISSACGYYFLTGVQTFGTEFVSGQYHVTQVFANLLLLVIGGGAVVGVLVAGPLSDMMLRRGHLDARITVAAIAATATTVLFIPALITHSILTALPYVVLAGAALSAQNPPIDAARLDIMPSWLWGRAEGIRTFLRTAAQALAPVLFGAVSGVFGGGTSGLRTTFAIMLLPLAAAAFFLFRARRSYPSDLVTAAQLTAE